MSLTPGPRKTPFLFLGNTREYFKIWIVNVFFTLVTLGIYSAWATVRTKRYFYGNTLLNNASFEYLTEPADLLKGRMASAGALLLYVVVTRFAPQTAPIFFAIFALAVPWLVGRGLGLALSNTRYCGLHFGFRGHYLRAFAVFVLLPAIPVAVVVAVALAGAGGGPERFPLLAWVALVAAALSYPCFVARKEKYLAEHASYGDTMFGISLQRQDLYSLHFKAFAGFVLLLLLSGLMAEMLFGTARVAGAATGHLAWETGRIAALAVMCLLGLVALNGYISTIAANLVLNHTQLAGGRLMSTTNPWNMAWIMLTNALAVVFSIGLLIPWARIRVTRYRLYNLSLLAEDNVHHFVAQAKSRTKVLDEGASKPYDATLAM